MSLSKSIYFSLVSLLALFTCCVTDKYDLEKDTSLGLSFSEKGFLIAGQSDIDIPMSQIVELNDSSELMVDHETGDYLFYKCKDDMDTLSVFVAHGSLCNGTYNELSFPLQNNEAVTLTPSIRYPDYGTLEFVSTIEPSYSPDILKESIRELLYLTTSLYVDIEMGFENLAGFGYLDEISYELPSFYVTDHPEELMEKNVSVNGLHSHSIHVAALDFSQDKLLPNERIGIDPVTHQLVLKGEVRIKGKVKMANRKDFEQAANPTIHYRVMIGTLGTFAVRGRFYQHESVDISPIEFGTLPDFIKDEEVIIDVENPILKLSLYNEVPADISLHGLLQGFRDDEVISTLQIGSEFQQPSISFPGPEFGGNGRKSNIWISRVPVKDLPDSVTENVVMPDIMNLVRRMPDKIVANVYAVTDSNKVTTLSLSEHYNVVPSYELVAPLTFGKDMQIVYNKEFGGLNDKLKELNISEIELSAKAENKIPLDLDFSIKALDIDSIEIKGFDYVLPQLAANSTQEICIKVKTANDNNLFRLLDQLHLKIYARSSEKLQGNRLNRNQNLYLSNIKFKLTTTN